MSPVLVWASGVFTVSAPARKSDIDQASPRPLP